MNSPHDVHGPSPKLRWVFWGFVAIAAFFLITEHAAHLYGALPFLLILVCPLMHVFGHHGHGGHRHDDASARKPDAEDDRPTTEHRH